MYFQCKIDALNHIDARYGSVMRCFVIKVVFQTYSSTEYDKLCSHKYIRVPVEELLLRHKILEVKSFLLLVLSLYLNEWNLHCSKFSLKHS